MLISGDPGTGKSIVLRLVGEHFSALPDVTVGTIEHRQSRVPDFYRELGDLFGLGAVRPSIFARGGPSILVVMLRAVATADPPSVDP